MPKVPAKKTSRKKTRASSARVPSSVKKDIKQAVDSLPELLADHTVWNTKQKSQTTNQPVITPLPVTQSQTTSQKTNIPYKSPKHSGLLLVTGVAFLMTTIVALWVWNMTGLINTVFTKPSEEKNILTNTKSDFNDIISYIEKQDSISNKLNELQAAAVLASTTSTTTSTTDVKAVLSKIINAPTSSNPIAN